MAPTPAEGLVQFLLSCIRHSNNGKIDFEAVAGECNIVSKGAAAKRYERLLKANNINPSSGSLASTPNNSPEKSTAATPTANTTSTTSTPTKKAGVKRKAAASKPASKKAKLMKKAAVMCAEDIVNLNQGSGDDDKNDDGENDDGENDDDENDDGENDDDDDGSLFKGVTI
ncbi:hypothetical protein N8T08_006747 [Aspergillus melleus]|uniref:Uncharacterized protein n=1 Tax=Aspergillus melleus TaxID=138277 RepID=A0ACC3AZS8_9EURO|nr:hypothetical protein N8T08_006747 [Aspergillus melleus]